MAAPASTSIRERHAGGRPPEITTLTPFGRVLDPILRRLEWNVYHLGEATGLLPSTLWWWMKKAKKWPPGDKVAIISAAVGQPIEPPKTRKAR
jgi:hypothetical protein